MNNNPPEFAEPDPRNGQQCITCGKPVWRCDTRWLSLIGNTGKDHAHNPGQLPLEVDTEIAGLDDKRFPLVGRLERILTDAHRYVGDKKTRLSSSRETWTMSHTDALVKLREMVAAGEDKEVRIGIGARGRCLENYETVRAQVRELDEQIDALEAVWRVQKWTRAFIVRGRDGHIHKSRSCHTCRPTTDFGWLPQLSGQSEEEIVAAAGEMACTVCYPSAPVDVLRRASTIPKMPKRTA